ncbi:MAG: sulfurtransferase TusA family protein [Angustibacter sp.]
MTARPVVVDARGLRCPQPVIRLAAQAKGLPDGTVIDVLTTDPAAEQDVPAWCRMRSHTWLGVVPIVDRAGAATGLRLRVRLGQ